MSNTTQLKYCDACDKRTKDLNAFGLCVECQSREPINASNMMSVVKVSSDGIARVTHSLTLEGLSKREIERIIKSLPVGLLTQDGKPLEPMGETSKSVRMTIRRDIAVGSAETA